MTTTRLLLAGLSVLLTATAYAVGLVATGFLACGISGCSGGGFGPSFDPQATQMALLVTGATLAPLAVLALGGRGPRAAAALGATLVGAVLTMTVLDLGPHGCPLGQSRAVVGPDGWDPGSPTCSTDRYALP